MSDKPTLTVEQQLRGRCAQLEVEVQHLKAQLQWLQRKVFGSQSERYEPGQALMDFAGAAAEVPVAPVEVTYQRPAAAPKKPLRLDDAQALERLPIEQVVEILPDEVRANPGAYERIGEERTVEVDIHPPRLFGRAHVRPKFKLREDRTQAPVVAKAPERLVSGGYGSAGLVAWVLTSKYVDHLPLYRQEKMLTRWGFAISRQTLGEWVGLAEGQLVRVHRQMKAGLLEGPYLQVDETPIRYLDPDGDRTSREGWMWAISRPGDDVVFEWRLSREHGHALTLLENYEGVLQSDGYQAYPKWALANPGRVHVACWAHTRRYFENALSTEPKAGQMLELIQKLYRQERLWDEAKLLEGRSQARQEHHQPIYQQIHQKAQELQNLCLPQSPLGKACHYLLGHWPGLQRLLDYDFTRLDNNLMENAIRPSALGKKNWLFIGSPEAGDRTAIIYSLVVSCQRHGKDPLAYLRHVLTVLPTLHPTADLKPLLPKNWQPV